MLICHFEAETQGFQGLVDQNDRGKGKPKSPKNHKKILKETFFEGIPEVGTNENEGHK